MELASLPETADQEINYSGLPYDSVLAAQIRMAHNYHTTGRFDAIDCEVVDGDPVDGVTLSPDSETMIRESVSYQRRREEFFDKNRDHLMRRHQQFIETLRAGQ